MSNQFPNHPLPLASFLTLAMNSEVIAKDLVLALAVPQTLLLISPPPAAVGNEPNTVRMIRNPDGLGGSALVNNTGANPVDVLTIIKIDGVEYILDTSTIAAGTVEPVGPAAQLFPVLASDDGVYLRFTSLLGTTVQVTSTYTDVRNVQVVDVELAQGVKTTLLANSDGDTNPFGEFAVPTTFLNADPLVGGQAVVLSFSDGVDEVIISPVPAVPPVGIVVPPLAGLPVPLPLAIPNGGSLFATLGVSAAVQPVLARVAYVETNSGPARPNQGGAF